MRGLRYKRNHRIWHHNTHSLRDQMKNYDRRDNFGLSQFTTEKTKIKQRKQTKKIIHLW